MGLHGPHPFYLSAELWEEGTTFVEFNLPEATAEGNRKKESKYLTILVIGLF